MVLRNKLFVTTSQSRCHRCEIVDVRGVAKDPVGGTVRCASKSSEPLAVLFFSKAFRRRLLDGGRFWLGLPYANPHWISEDSQQHSRERTSKSFGGQRWATVIALKSSSSVHPNSLHQYRTSESSQALISSAQSTLPRCVTSVIAPFPPTFLPADALTGRKWHWFP